jgi:hypothetical protein
MGNVPNIMTKTLIPTIKNKYVVVIQYNVISLSLNIDLIVPIKLGSEIGIINKNVKSRQNNSITLVMVILNGLIANDKNDMINRITNKKITIPAMRPIISYI